MAFVKIEQMKSEKLRGFSATVLGFLKLTAIFCTSNGGHMDLSFSVGPVGAGVSMSLWELW